MCSSDLRQSQWRWDWVAAANGLGFHSPVEASRTLANSIQKAEAARALIVRVLAKRGFTDPVPLPDISSKAKAQAFIGLNMDQLKSEKADFISKILPEWDAKAKARQAKY